MKAVIPILLAPAVSAHPLMSARDRLRLKGLWDGPVLSSRGSEHAAHSAGANTDPRHLAARILSEHETLREIVIVHNDALPLEELRSAHPDVRFVLVTVDADAYAPEIIIDAVTRALAQPADGPW